MCVCVPTIEELTQGGQLWMNSKGLPNGMDIDGMGHANFLTPQVLEKYIRKPKNPRFFSHHLNGNGCVRLSKVLEQFALSAKSVKTYLICYHLLL